MSPNDRIGAFFVDEIVAAVRRCVENGEGMTMQVGGPITELGEGVGHWVSPRNGEVEWFSYAEDEETYPCSVARGLVEAECRREREEADAFDGPRI